MSFTLCTVYLTTFELLKVIQKHSRFTSNFDSHQPFSLQTPQQTSDWWADRLIKPGRVRTWNAKPCDILSSQMFLIQYQDTIITYQNVIFKLSNFILCEWHTSIVSCVWIGAIGVTLGKADRTTFCTPSRAERLPVQHFGCPKNQTFHDFQHTLRVRNYQVPARFPKWHSGWGSDLENLPKHFRGVDNWLNWWIYNIYIYQVPVCTGFFSFSCSFVVSSVFTPDRFLYVHLVSKSFQIPISF